MEPVTARIFCISVYSIHTYIKHNMDFFQCALLQTDSPHRGHRAVPVPGLRPGPLLQPRDGGRSRGNRENLHGGKHPHQTGQQSLQFPHSQHVCPGMKA